MVVPCVEGFLLELASEDLLGAVEDVDQVGVVRVRVIQKQVVGFQFNLNKEYRRYKFFLLVPCFVSICFHFGWKVENQLCCTCLRTHN